MSRKRNAASDVEARPALRWRNLAALALLLVGLTAMAGDATGLDWLKGLGVATVAAPLPKVFSDVDGFETFAADFTLEIGEPGGGWRQERITPRFYARLRGPYNRRNVYGAALSYAPRLPEALWRAAFCHGFAPHGPLRREFGIDPEVRRLRVVIATRTRGRDDRFVLEPECPG